MNRKVFLTAIAAALMFAASCGKEDGSDSAIVQEPTTESVTQAEPQNVEEPVATTRPIVIRATKGETLSKVSSEDGYTLTFDASDKLVLNYADGSECITLDMEGDGAGKTTATFKGEIPTAADYKELYAEIGTALSGVACSNTSLADVVSTNCYMKSSNFTYDPSKEITGVELVDQNAYLVFNVAAGQKKVELGGTWYPTDADITNRAVYFAIPSGQAISGRFFGTKKADEVVAGKIYTIKRENVVDPGVSVLWCVSNENGVYEKLNWDEAMAAYPNENSSGFKLPTADQFKELTGQTTVANVTVTPNWKTGTGVEAGLVVSTAYAELFFPAEGWDNPDNDLGTVGSYWTSSSTGIYERPAYRMESNSSTKTEGYVESSETRFHYSIRLVKDLP